MYSEIISSLVWELAAFSLSNTPHPERDLIMFSVRGYCFPYEQLVGHCLFEIKCPAESVSSTLQYSVSAVFNTT